jgi:dipeptidyl aminopeptidase/acylaminoacyl peptidase
LGESAIAKKQSRANTANPMNGSPASPSKQIGIEHLVERPAGAGNWSSDGAHVAFFRPDSDGIPRLLVCSSDGGSERQLSDLAIYLELGDGTDRRDVMGGPQWAPNSSAIAFLTDGESANGGWIRIVDWGQSGARAALRHRALDRTPRWSPDGRRIAFIGRRDGHDDIYVGDVDGRPVQLTFSRWDNTDPDWSPDGSTLAFISQRSDKDLFSNSICTVPASGGEVTRLTHDDRSNDRSPKWSPDGRTLAFVSNREDVDDIWLIEADGSDLRQLTSGPGDKGDPRWSPDGARIAFTRVYGGSVDIQMTSKTGDESTPLVSGGVNLHPRWSPDGHEILYLHADHAHEAELWVTSVGSGKSNIQRQLTASPGPSHDGIEFSRPTVETFKSRDGMEITGLLYEPPRPAAAGGPAILWIRGGPNAVHVDGWHPLLQFFAQRGYTVFAPNYRGSTGYGRTFMEANFGSTTRGDMDDFVGAADFLKSMPTVDPNRVAIMGHSYGGYAVLLALGLHPSEFAAGIALAAPSNWFNYWENCEISWGRRLHVKLMGVPSQNRALQSERNPIIYADRYADPVLILHGEADWGVPVAQAREMREVLQGLGKQVECVIYPGEGHVYSGPDAIADSAQRIESFLQKHLGSTNSKTPVQPAATPKSTADS